MMDIGAVDLFCGIGGLTNGLKSAGINVVAGIDIDPSCAFAYSENNKCAFIEKSIDDVHGDDINKILSDYKCRILVGCAPCQPFSSHRKDKSDRSKHKDWRLLYQFGRLVKEAHPDVVSMENVPELEQEKVFSDFVSTLKEENYHVTYKVVNVSDYGVPQHRRRLILLASKRGKICLIPPTHTTPVTVRDAIGRLPIIYAGQKCDADRLHIAPSLSALNLERIQHSVPGGTWKDWPDRLILRCHKKESGKTYPSVYGRMKWDGLAPTITTQFTCYGTGRFGHPEQDRAISLREGAILQSFPARYKFIPDEEPVVNKAVARHIGNAVPPRLGEIIGISILKSLNEEG